MTAEKDVQVAQKKGRGRGNLGNARKKHSFLNEVFPNLGKAPKKTFIFMGGLP